MALELDFDNQFGDSIAGGYAKIVSAQYANGNSGDPHAHCEVAFYKGKAQADASAPPYFSKPYRKPLWAPGGSEGSLTAVAGSALVDGETFTIDDGLNDAVVFEFDDDESVSETATLKAVVFDAGDDVAAVKAAMLKAIQASKSLTFCVRAFDGADDDIDLVNVEAKAAGDAALADTVADAGFVVSGMTGGSDAVDMGAYFYNWLKTLPDFAGAVDA